MRSFQLDAKWAAKLLAVVMLLSASIDASAQAIPLSSETDQTAVELSAIENPEAVRALVSPLSDNEVRDLLLQQLDVVAEKQNTESVTGEVSLFNLITTTIPITVGAAVIKTTYSFIDKCAFDAIWFGILVDVLLALLLLSSLYL